MNRRTLLILCVAAAAFFPGGLMAAQPETLLLRPAVIDLDLIRREAAVFKDVRAQIIKYHEGLQAENKKDEEKLRNESQELARKRTILSPDAFADERRKFEQRLEDVQRVVQDRKRGLDRVQEEAMRKVGRALTRVITDMAKQLRLTLILRKDQTFFVANQLDITGEVLKRLDKAMPSLKLNPPKTTPKTR